ncbi:MAG: hypothetical protein MIO90_04485, partial [Methanomassiliicoccales archaeon]|nr:hypothetical protein [Methanomassiliicoccales archaeon]
MAEESNVHIKLAGAEVLGLFLISLVTILVGMYGLEVIDSLGVILAVAWFVGLGLFLTTIIAYLNENILVSAAFGLFAIFLLGFANMANGGDSTSCEIYSIFVGLGVLMIALVSFAQPVKILPIFLIIAALAFISLGLWFDMGEDVRILVGIL